MAELKVERVPCGYQGLDTESAPEAVPDGFAPEHRNFLLHHEMEMHMRGPLTDHTTLTIGSDVIVTGIWSFGNAALVGLAATNATATREPWRAPYSPATAAELAEPVTTMKLVDFDAMTVSNVAAAQGTVIMGRGTRIGDKVYGFAYSGGTDDDTGATYVHRRSLLAWDGTTSAPAAVANAPDSGLDIITHFNRLFTLGGRDVPGGGTTHEFNTLYFSDNGGPVSALAAEWQDDVSGLTNKIVVDADNPDDFGVALGKAGDALVILKRHSVHLLTGYDQDTFTLKPYSQDVGCVDARSVVQFNDGVYFMSEEGYMFFDGSVLEPVDDMIRTEIVANVDQTVGRHGSDGSKVHAIKLPNHYILLTIVNQSFIDGSLGTVQASYLYHAPTRRWSRFDSAATANPVPVAAGNTHWTTFLIDGDHAVKADYITIPEACPSDERGFDSVASTDARITPQWKSRLIRFGTPLFMSQFHRVLVDYKFVLDDGADSDQLAWYVSAQEGTGREVLAEYQLYAMGDDTAYLYRRRNVHDEFNEVSDAQLTIEWHEDDSTPAVNDARIFDCYIEYQTTRQRRST